MYGMDYAEGNKEVKEYYKIEIARTKTGHPVRIIVEQTLLLPYTLPFTEGLKGLSDEEYNNSYVYIEQEIWQNDICNISRKPQS